MCESMAGDSSGSVNVSKDNFSDWDEMTKIGIGSFGLVYKAQHRTWGEVALKRPKEDGKLLKKFEKPMLEQACTLIHLRHPHLVTVLGVVWDTTIHAIVMEYYRLGNLTQFFDGLEMGEVGIWAKVALARGVVLGVAYLHSLDPSVVHGDLMGRNVLVDNELNAKVCDFGLSKWRIYSARAAQGPVTANSDNKLSSNISHVAPEILEDINYKVTRECDSYSFGVLLWEIFSEEQPFGRASKDQIIHAILNGQRPDLLLLPRDVPDRVLDLVRRSWSQKSDQRPDFSDILHEFDELSATSGELIKSQTAQLRIKVNQRDTSWCYERLSLGVDAICTSPGHGDPPKTLPVPVLSHSGSSVALETMETLEMAVEPRTNCDNGFPPSTSVTAISPPPTYFSVVNQSGLAGEGTRYGDDSGVDKGARTPSPPSNTARSINDEGILTDNGNAEPPSCQSSSLGSAPDSPPLRDAPPCAGDSTSNNLGQFSMPENADSNPRTYSTTVRQGSTGTRYVHIDGCNSMVQIGDRNYLFIRGQGDPTNGGGGVTSDSNGGKREVEHKKIKVPSGMVNNEAMEKISRGLGQQWRPLSRKLGFSDAQAEGVAYDYGGEGLQEIAYQMLRKWREARGPGATYKTLAQALCAIERPNLAQLLSSDSGSNSCSGGNSASNGKDNNGGGPGGVPS